MEESDDQWPLNKGMSYGHKRKKGRGKIKRGQPAEKLTLMKWPYLEDITGQLKRLSSLKLFSYIKRVIKKVRYHVDFNTFLTNLFEILRNNFRTDDVALIALFMGYHTAQTLSHGVRKEELVNNFQMIGETISKYNVKNRAIVEAEYYFFLFNIYVCSGKLDKALQTVQQAKMSTHMILPCTWTSRYHLMDAWLQESFAYKIPSSGRQNKFTYHQAAIECYKLVNNHIWCDQSGDFEENRPQTIANLMNMVYLTLEMPTAHGHNITRPTNIVLQCAQTYSPGKEAVDTAQYLINEAKRDIFYLGRYTTREDILMAEIYLLARKTQLNITSCECEAALDNLNQMIDHFNSWVDMYGQYDSTMLCIHDVDIKVEELIDVLENEVLIAFSEQMSQNVDSGDDSDMEESGFITSSTEISFKAETDENVDIESTTTDTENFEDGEECFPGDVPSQLCDLNSHIVHMEEDNKSRLSIVNETSSNLESQESDVLEGY